MPNERKAFLKRVLKIVAIVLAVVIAPFALLGGYVAVDRLIGNIYYDRTKTEIKLSGNIFDEPLMKKVDLAFLQKPENGADESFSAKQYYVSYSAYYSSEEVFSNYVQAAFDSMKADGYLLCVSIGWSGNDRLFSSDDYMFAKQSETLSDFEEKFSGNDKQYAFCYTLDGTAKNRRVDGKKQVKNAKILTISLDQDLARGDYKIVISIDTNVRPTYLC